MFNSVDKIPRNKQVPPIQNNLSEQIRIYEDSVKNDQSKMTKHNISST